MGSQEDQLGSEKDEDIDAAARLKGYADFFLSDGRNIYRNPRLYDMIVNEWLGRPHLARRTTDVVMANSTGSQNVLELGAGSGILTLMLADAGASIVATDLEERALEALERKAGTRLNQSIRVLRLDMNQSPWPFEDSSFDSVVTLRANRYITNLERYLREVHRVLRPRGTFILPVFALDIITWKMHSEKGILQPTIRLTIAKLLRSIGFEVSEEVYEESREDVLNLEGLGCLPFFYRPAYLIAKKISVTS